MEVVNHAKRLSHKERLLSLLSDHKWHGMRECMEHGGMRYGARLHELKHEGWPVEKRLVFADVYEYRLAPRAGQLELL